MDGFSIPKRIIEAKPFTWSHVWSVADLVGGYFSRVGDLAYGAVVICVKFSDVSWYAFHEILSFHV